MLKIYTTYGLGITIVLIVYFLFAKLIGLHEYPSFSAVNGLIFGAGIYLALKKYGSKDKNMKYERAFEVGFLSGVIASILFTIFMAIYMYQIDSEFDDAIMAQWNMEEALSTFMLLVAILIMGVATSLVLTLTFMQLLKKSWNTKDGDRNTL